LLPRYKVGHLFIGSNDDADDGFASLISSLRKSGTEIHYPISGDRLDFADQCQLDFLPPVDAANNANDNSLGFLFNCFGTSMLSLGDLGSFGEENLVNNHQGRLAAEIFKVSHHGSSSSNSNKLLSEVHPALAIISVGEGNSYGHPSQETIERLYDSGARIWRTDLDGELNILF
jgi:competence protein ComEC